MSDLDLTNKRFLTLFPKEERAPLSNLFVTAVRYGIPGPYEVVGHAQRELRARLRQTDLTEERRRTFETWLRLLVKNHTAAADLARFYLAYEQLDRRQRSDFKAAVRLARLA